MVAWILTQSVSQIFNGNHIKDLWTFCFPQKSAVSNISFQEASEYQISLVFTLRSLNSILGKWTHFETWDSIKDFFLFGKIMISYLDTIGFSAPTSFLSFLLTIYSDKKTICVNSSYFSYFFSKQIDHHRDSLKRKEIDLLLTHTKWVK